MDTPTSRLTLVDDSPRPPRRRRTALWLRTHAWAREPGNWITTAVVAVAAGIVLAVLSGLVWLFVTLATLIGDGLSAAGNGLLGAANSTGEVLSRFGDWAVHGPITTCVITPVRAYLDQHAAGVPATGDDLWILWLAAAGVLYAAAFLGSTYGRIGWAALGALTAAAAWHGTALAASRPIAAGVTATVWLVLSLFVYTRRRRTPVIDWAEVERRMNRDRGPVAEPATEPA